MSADRPDNQLYDLEHYALKSMDLGRLTGVSIGCHAIPDAFLLMHVGVGCKNKAVAHLMAHDLSEAANLRECWTEVSDRDLILGASRRAAPYMRSWYDRSKPALMVMTSVTFIDLAGEDLADKVAQAAKDLPCRVELVPAAGFDGDLYAGYATMIHTIASHVDWSSAPTNEREVAVLGYLFDRYEKDHVANLHQIRQLLDSIGLSLGPVLLSGKPYETLLEAGKSATVVELPYTRPAAKKLSRTLGNRETVQTDLPIGLAGTSRWLRTVAEGAGVLSPQTEAIIARHEERARGQIQAMFDRWRGMRVAVFADPPLAGGLCSMLVELGLHPVLVGLKGRTMGGPDEFHAVPNADGNPLPEDTEVIADPSLALIGEKLTALLRDGALDGVFGSATDINALSALPLSDLIAGHAADPKHPQGPFIVEVGFPCKDWHALYPMPFVGYRGVVAWAQRILTARRLWDAGRQPHLPIF